MSSRHDTGRGRSPTPDRYRGQGDSSHRDRYKKEDSRRSTQSHSRSKYPEKSKDKKKARERSRSVETSRKRGESSSKHESRRRDISPTPNTKVTSLKKGKERSRSRKRSTSKDKKKSKEHKKKSRKESSSSGSESSSNCSSSGSSQGDSELKLLQKLEANRLKMCEEKRKQKELMKANETPEEKRARRLAKKRLKERSRRARAGWHASHQGYTDHDNPFGDAALTDTFVWNKKLARLPPEAATPEELERINRQTQIENKIELEKVAARRAARLAAGALEAEGARAREDAHYSAWAALEHAFHLQQARLRSHIRVRDQRAKPIDLLAWYISSPEAADALHMHEPYTFLQGLSAADLDDLLEDIKVYMELEGGEHAEYWRDVLYVVQDERRASRLAARPAVHASVAPHVTQVLRGKSPAALRALEAEVRVRVTSPRPGLDVSYWETLLTQLQAHMARARLRELHQRNLRKKLDTLRQEQGLAGDTSQDQEGGSSRKQEGGSSHKQEGGSSQKQEGGSSHKQERGAAELREQKTAPELEEDEPEPGPSCSRNEQTEGVSEGEGSEEEESSAEEAWRQSGYSPPRLQESALEATVLLRDELEDVRQRAALRAAKCGARSSLLLSAEAGETEVEAALQRAMCLAEGAGAGAVGGGGRFAGEVAVSAPPPAWSDKYRPRKPRYFNRVHTGFEWNKYNQTHYDMDNPPPKIVQGYKFNIFYPELIDKQTTPAFSLKPCPENGEFAILRFSAGPPYEDIAFKIVNREWEYSYKRGFRCHFHNNIFQLWFHFKRYRYRR